MPKLLKTRWFRGPSIALAVLLAVALLVLFIPGVRVEISQEGFLSLTLTISEVRAAIVVTPLGTNQNKSSTDPWTVFSSIALSSGDTLILTASYDPSSAPTVTWNSISLTMDVTRTNSPDVTTSIWHLSVASGATGDVVIDWTPGGVPVATAATLYKATGLATNPFDKSATNTGSGADATAGPTATLSQADELCIGATGVEDEFDDPHGTWTTGATYISGNEQFDATNGAGDASNIQAHSVAEIVSATTAQNIADTGHDSTDWAAVIATYKMDLGGEPDIANAPTTWVLNGITGDSNILVDTVYYANPLGDTTTPSATVVDAECRFLITNSSTMAIDLTLTMGNFAGGDANMTNSDTGANGATAYGAYSWFSGDLYANKVVIKTAGSAVGKDGLAALTDIRWGAEVETQTDAWAGGTSSTATLTITATVD